MTQEDKDLLLKDLCVRLPYGVKMYHPSSGFILPLAGIDNNGCITIGNNIIGYYTENIGYGCKPYLRPMSSMTEEEKKEYNKTCIAKFRKAGPGYTYDGWWEYYDTIASFDYLNANHFDYRGLIPKGLAIEVTEENNPYKSY